MKRLAELEELQIRILHRISDLELSHLPHSFSHSLSLSSSAADDSAATTEHRLSAILRANAVRDFSFKRVPSNYYDWTLEARRDVLAAASIDHLCKSIVLGLGFRLTAPKAQGAYALVPWPEISSEPGWLAERPCQCLLVAVGERGSWAAAGLRRSFCDHRPVGLPIFYRNNPSFSKVNTQAPPDVIDCSNRNYSKYYVVVVQYTARFNAETVKNFLYTLNNGKISKKKFNMRLAPEETSAKLTGYEHNGVTCIGMKTDIPVILDEAIVKLNPDFFWLGGGEIDLKLGIRTSEFINYVKPFIINCSGS